MNNSALRLFVRSIIAEAKDKKDKEPKKAIKKEAEDKKSSKKEDSKLVNLKKKLAVLKKYRDELQAAKFAEQTAETEVEFADLAGFAKELKTIKDKGVALEEKIDSRIEELEQEIKDAINTVKEMMGLVPEKAEKPNKPNKPEQKPMTSEARYNTSANSKEAQYLKKGDIITSGDEVISVSSGAKTPSGKVEVTLKTKDGKTKTSVWGKTTKVGVKKDIEEARFPKGTDIGKPGKGFEKIAKSAAKKYGSKEAGQKVAGAILKKVVKK